MIKYIEFRILIKYVYGGTLIVQWWDCSALQGQTLHPFTDNQWKCFRTNEPLDGSTTRPIGGSKIKLLNSLKFAITAYKNEKQGYKII